jgi:tetratricopeptide (TPR) repeat protein
MKRSVLISLVILSVSLDLVANRSEIYNAYISNRMDLWEQTMIRMERELKTTGGQAERYALTEAQYGYIAYCLSEGWKKEAAYWLKKAETNLGLLLDSDPENPRLFSMKGALYGYALLLEPVKAPFLGRRSANASDRALELGPAEPIVWMEKANMEFYKPALFGGSAGNAIPLYEKAIELFEERPEDLRENWLYLNSLTNLAQAYEKNGQPLESEKICRKLLKMEPSFHWIRHELCSRLREKQAER